MKRIFLVEDDTSLGQSLSERLSQDYHVTWVQTAGATLAKIAEIKKCDLVILDVGLPDGNGFELAKKIREQSPIPFLFLTAQADAESRLQGYQLGAEEFIPKPFHLKELLLRLSHVLKSQNHRSRYIVGPLEIFFENLQIKGPGSEVVTLPDSEMRVLQILIRQSPGVVDRDLIMNEVWGLESELSHRSIDNIIVKLRTYLKSQSDHIKTVRGRGYQWLEEKSEKIHE